MVVFTCNHCGDAVQKPKVEKHYDTKCRRPKDLTCVDCLKDFRGEEFFVHTLCVTEDQRYSAKGTEQKPMKGMQKQESWVDIIQSCYDSEPACKQANLQATFKAILGQTNIPRKKQKFLNFITSANGNRIKKDDAGVVFDLIQNYFIKQKVDKTVEKDDSADKDENNATKKRKLGENEEIKPEMEESQQQNKKNKKNKQNGAANDSSAVRNEVGSSNANKSDASAVNTKSSNKKANKFKNKQQGGVANDSSVVQNGVGSSNDKKVDTTAVNAKSSNKKAKKLRNKQRNAVVDKAVVQNGAEVVKDGADSGIVSKSKKRRLRNKQRALKKIKNTENIDKNEDKAISEKTNKKKNKGKKVMETPAEIAA